jgi:hypothetical protein
MIFNEEEYKLLLELDDETDLLSEGLEEDHPVVEIKNKLYELRKKLGRQ